MQRILVALGVGAVAGFASGLVGIGGGLVMVPLLVGLLSLAQHSAHATSLGAIVVIAAVGAATFGSAGEIDLPAAGSLALGALVGAPLGARLMASTSEARLKIAFGLLMIGVGAVLIAT